jgi:hypothetical protein
MRGFERMPALHNRRTDTDGDSRLHQQSANFLDHNCSEYPETCDKKRDLKHGQTESSESRSEGAFKGLVSSAATGLHEPESFEARAVCTLHHGLVLFLCHGARVGKLDRHPNPLFCQFGALPVHVIVPS